MQNIITNFLVFIIPLQSRKKKVKYLKLVTKLTAFGFWNKRESLCLQSSSNLSSSLNVFVVLGINFKTYLFQRWSSDKWGFLRYWWCPLSDPVESTVWDISWFHWPGYRQTQAKLPCLYSHRASDTWNVMKPQQIFWSCHKCRFHRDALWVLWVLPGRILAL